MSIFHPGPPTTSSNSETTSPIFIRILCQMYFIGLTPLSFLPAMLMSFAYAVPAGLHNNDQARKGKKQVLTPTLVFRQQGAF